MKHISSFSILNFPPTLRVGYLHGLKVQPNLTDVIPTLRDPPLTGPRRGVAGRVAWVPKYFHNPSMLLLKLPDVSDISGDSSTTAAGAQNTASPETCRHYAMV